MLVNTLEVRINLNKFGRDAIETQIVTSPVTGQNNEVIEYLLDGVVVCKSVSRLENICYKFLSNNVILLKSGTFEVINTKVKVRILKKLEIFLKEHSNLFSSSNDFEQASDLLSSYISNLEYTAKSLEQKIYITRLSFTSDKKLLTSKKEKDYLVWGDSLVVGSENENATLVHSKYVNRVGELIPRFIIDIDKNILNSKAICYSLDRMDKSTLDLFVNEFSKGIVKSLAQEKLKFKEIESQHLKCLGILSEYDCIRMLENHKNGEL